jgi:hypothetical protein
LLEGGDLSQSKRSSNLCSLCRGVVPRGIQQVS